MPTPFRFARRLLFAVLAWCLNAAPAIAQLRLQDALRFKADDGHMLRVHRLAARGPSKGTLLLLHGRTWSSLPNFDLHAGRQSHSVMEDFAARGYTVYALDQRGYGATARDSSGWLTPDRAASDVAIVLDSIAGRSGKHAAGTVVIGYSQGTRYGALAIMRHPEHVRAFVMYGFAVDVTSQVPLNAADGAAPRARTTEAGAAEDFITPASTLAGVKDAYVRSATTLDPVRADWRHDEQFNAIDPSALRVPVLILHGERDPVALHTHPEAFYARLAGIDRAWVVLANSDHVAHLERRDAWVSAISRFVEGIRR